MSRFPFHRGFAKGRTVRRAPGVMNKTEQAYAAQLEVRKSILKIADFKFDCIKLRLADKTFVTLDFFVLMPDGTMEFHEVKGHWEDDARVKIKVAAEQYPYFTFKAVTTRAKKDGGGWAEEVF